MLQLATVLQLATPVRCDPRPALSDLDVSTLAATLREWDAPPSHAPRILREFFRTGTVDAAALSLSRALWRRMQTELRLRQSRVPAQHTSGDGTTKLLIAFDGGGGGGGGGSVESVLMPSPRPDRAAGCISSQIGCAMGCDFCASTRGGLERNLTAGEIVEQFLHLQTLSAAQGRRLATLVFMGMGEPLHNLDAVADAIRRITDPRVAARLGPRAITVSTVGIVPGIEQLTRLKLGVHLAVSLHAPDDATRARIVPTARRFRVAEIIAAAKDFAAQSGRYVTIEYTLLAGVNDSDEQAVALAELLRGFRAHVNLIPYNPTGPGVSGRIYERSLRQRMERFAEILSAAGTVVHFRRTRGDDVNAACGQLRQTSSPVLCTPLTP
jgi:23S rRNA (adenine2503-C2)-methyltransferase